MFTIRHQTLQVRGDTVTTVVLETVTMEDAGDYKIHAKNPGGEDSCVATLKVQGAPLEAS